MTRAAAAQDIVVLAMTTTLAKAFVDRTLNTPVALRVSTAGAVVMHLPMYA